MTRCSSFLNRHLSSFFSGLASVVCRQVSLVSLLRAGIRRPSSPLLRLSGLVWHPASVVRRPSLGFSLVEVTLALMVMAIGILSIMSLFPAGLDQNARSIADTHAAFFAEEVFGGLQAKAETNWAQLEGFNVPVAASNMWPGMTNKVHVTDYVSVVTNSYTYNGFEDHALRYRLVVTNVIGRALLKSATLWVWPGEFGGTNDPAMFYAEFFRFRPD